MLSYLLFITCTDFRQSWWSHRGILHRPGLNVSLWKELMILIVLAAKMTSLREVGAMSSLSSFWITQDAFLSSLPHPQGSYRKGQNARKSNRIERVVLSQPQIETSGLDERGFEYCVALLPSSLHQDCRHHACWFLRQPSVAQTSSHLQPAQWIPCWDLVHSYLVVLFGGYA